MFIYLKHQICTPKQGKYTTIKTCSPSFNVSDNNCLGHYESEVAGASKAVIRSKQVSVRYSQCSIYHFLTAICHDNTNLNVFICVCLRVGFMH